MTPPDPHGLESLELLEALCALSRQERVMMAQLATTQLEELGRAKQAHLDRLRALSLDPRSPGISPDTRRRLRVAAQRLDVESKANLALFGEAISAMGHAMGAVTPTTYDARARLRSSVSPLARRSL